MGKRFLLSGFILFLLVVSFSSLPLEVHAQFLRLTFEIESELEAEELNPLRFGQVVPNAGVIQIRLGDPDMGTYAISGPQNLTVEMNLDLPDYLELEGDQTFQVPMRLQAAYANRNQNETRQAIPVQGGQARFPLRADAPLQVSPDIPAPSATAYIYIYGEIEVGDIPPGTYDANVFMTVEYE